MRKTLLKTLTFVVLLLLGITTVSFAVPADPRPATVKQSNGKTLTFYLRGDERCSWAVTLDGYTLLTDKNGNYVYAVQDNAGNMIASSRLAANEDERTAEDVKFLSKVQKNIRYTPSQLQSYHKLWDNKVSTKYEQAHFPATGGQKNLLVVLVNFSDLAITTDKSVFENMCMQENYNGTGSIHDYFYTNSDGELDLQIDVVGPVTLPNSMSYYGGQTTYGSYVVHDKNTRAFVEDAVKQVAKIDGFDFSKYDNDGDKIVDDIAFIFAGTPESSTGHADEIWPHSSQIQGTAYYNGVRINRYTCSAEMSQAGQADATIGTFCHEFGHALGLPDEYDTDYGESGGTSVTVGTWSVMCQGSYNNNSNSPALWSAGQKIYTGWIDTVITLTATTDSLRLPVITGQHDTAYRIDIPGTYEFFLIENRVREGFDAYIPGNGMLIYHGQMNKINRWINYGDNSINVNPSDRGWYIEPADGLLNSTTTAAAAFPGTKNINYFLDVKRVNGTVVDNVAITNIHYAEDSVIVFNFNSASPVIRTNNYSSRTASSLTVSGKILYKGTVETAAKGVVYSLEEDCPYIAENAVLDTLTAEDSISLVLSGLTNNTRYYYRAFIQDNDGNTYCGDIKTAMTQSGFGFATTKAATNIDSTGATLNGKLELIGQGEFVEKGFVYVIDDDQTDPTFDNEKVVVDGDEIGDYSYQLSTMQQGSVCYYRVFVTNTFGTYFGTKMKFQTLYPSITNNEITADQRICVGSTPNELQGASAEGGFGDFTYLWQQQEGNNAWTDAEGTNDGLNYQPNALNRTTKYRRIATSVGRFSHTSNVITVEAVTSVGGTLSSSKNTYQKGEDATITLRNYTGSIVEWFSGTDTAALNSVGNAGLASLTQTMNEVGTVYFQVKVQIDNCEPAMSSLKSVIVAESSINDADNAVRFDIIPNPSSNGTFTIDAAVENAQSLVITNSLGQVVYYEKDVHLHNKTITLDNAENGVYIISIISGDTLTAKKLIINK